MKMIQLRHYLRIGKESTYTEYGFRYNLSSCSMCDGSYTHGHIMSDIDNYSGIEMEISSDMYK